MSVEGNLRIAASLAEAVDSKDWNRIRNLFDKRAVLRMSGSLGAAIGIEDAIGGWKAEADTFPDARREILRGFGQGNRVCIEIRETGTHKGPLVYANNTHRATGKRFQIGVCAVLAMRRGKIAEMTAYYDPQEHLVQLGIL